MNYKTPNKTCIICGQSYWRPLSRLEGSRFCSRSCKDAFKGGFDKEALKELYYQRKWSMQQIADHYACSVNKVVYWMRTYGFERRDWSEATYVTQVSSQQVACHILDKKRGLFKRYYQQLGIKCL